MKVVVVKGKIFNIYCASTKGNTVLQYFGLDNSRIVAAERNLNKWGKVTIDTQIPIISEEEARKAKPDHFLVLPWHIIEVFIQQEKEFLMLVGRCILPVQHFTLI